MDDFSKNPYLSIVIASRNDEHGGNPLQRTQVAFNGIFEHLETHRIESELILVDWNPPMDRPLLKDVIKWPKYLKYCTIRYLVVPHSIHQLYKNHRKILLHTVIAINCGIKRARGQFILPGVIDLLYSEELISFIASRKLDENERYRVDRYDVNKAVVNLKTLKEQLDYSEKNVLRINAHLHSEIQNGLPELHTNACGDFQLMSRKFWRILRGYREADIATAHVDSLLSYASYAIGVKEVFLPSPMRIYHIEHTGKFIDRKPNTYLPFEKWLSLPFISPRFSRKMITFISIVLIKLGYKRKAKFNGVPVLGYDEYLEICRDMVSKKRSYIFNDENWGLGNIVLEDTVISKAEWDK